MNNCNVYIIHSFLTYDYRRKCPIRLKLVHNQRTEYTQPMNMVQNFKVENEYNVFYPDPENIHMEITFYMVFSILFTLSLLE